MIVRNREVGRGHPPLVIAEIGVNHDGSPQRALELVEAAAEAGADAVKFQYFQAERLMSRAATLAAYQRARGEHDPLAMLRRLEIGLDELGASLERAHSLGLAGIVTVFSVELVEQAAALPWDAFKSASPDLVHWPLLEAMSATGRPLIVSTGAATAEEIRETLARFGSAALHCVSSYPTPMDAAHLAGVGALADLLARIDGSGRKPRPVGYSDHTPGVHTGALAVAAGAVILEKHLTYDREAAGPDHAASLDPAGLAEYIRLAREAWAALGERRLGCGELEQDVRLKSRQSIVAARDLRAGQRLTTADLAIKRPGTGLSPRLLQDVIGRRLVRDVAADAPLAEADVDWGAAGAGERARRAS